MSTKGWEEFVVTCVDMRFPLKYLDPCEEVWVPSEGCWDLHVGCPLQAHGSPVSGTILNNEEVCPTFHMLAGHCLIQSLPYASVINLQKISCLMTFVFTAYLLWIVAQWPRVRYAWEVEPCWGSNLLTVVWALRLKAPPTSLPVWSWRGAPVAQVWQSSVTCCHLFPSCRLYPQTVNWSKSPHSSIFSGISSQKQKREENGSIDLKSFHTLFSKALGRTGWGPDQPWSWGPKQSAAPALFLSCISKSGRRIAKAKSCDWKHTGSMDTERAGVEGGRED